MILHSSWHRAEVFCHACDIAVTPANTSPVSETCAECLTDCLCFRCREVRWQMAVDRHAEVARMAWGERG